MNRRTPKALQILASTVAPLFLALYAAGQSAGISDFWSLIRIGDQAVVLKHLPTPKLQSRG